MLGDGLPNSGTQGSYFKYQYGVLKLLEQIAAAVAVIGPDNETRTTRYEVVAGPTPPGAGYSIGDFLVRYDIINTVTGTITSTIWFNQTLQTTLVGAGNPNPADIVPAAASLSTTVLNPFNLEATQLLVLADTNTIADDTTSLDTKLPPQGAAVTAASTPVNIASDQIVPVSLPSGTQALTSSEETDSTNSPVSSGATGVTFTTDNMFTGSINGVARAKSTIYSFTAAEGKTLPDIAYTVTGGSLIIDKLV